MDELKAQEDRAPYHALQGKDKQEVARQASERYLDGERMVDIAAELGVSDKRLYALMAEQDEEGWKRAQLAAAIQRLELAKEGIDAATDQLEIARARESARMAQWDLERVCRRIYGQEPAQVLGSGSVSISINFTAPQSADKPAIDSSSVREDE